MLWEPVTVALRRVSAVELARIVPLSPHQSYDISIVGYLTLPYLSRIAPYKASHTLFVSPLIASASVKHRSIIPIMFTLKPFKKRGTYASLPDSERSTKLPLTKKNIEFLNQHERNAGNRIQRPREVQISEWLRLIP